MSDRQPEYSLPRWASVDNSRVVEPSTGAKDYGFQKNYRPPAQWVNWLWKYAYLWLTYLRLFLIGRLEHDGFMRCYTLATLGSPDETWAVTVGPSAVVVLSGSAYLHCAETDLELANVLVGDKITTSGKTALYPHATYFVYVKDSGTVEEYEVTRTGQTWGWQTGAEGTKRFVGMFRTNKRVGLSPFVVDVGFPLPCIMQGDWVYYELNSDTYTDLEVVNGRTTLAATLLDFSDFVPALGYRTGRVKVQIEWTVTTGIGSFAVNGVPRFFANATGQYAFDLELCLDVDGKVSFEQAGISAGAYTVRITGFGFRKA